MTIPRGKTTKQDPTLTVGQEKVTEGHDGSKEVTTDPATGKSTEKITKKAVNDMVTVGTKPKQPASVSFRCTSNWAEQPVVTATVEDPDNAGWTLTLHAGTVAAVRSGTGRSVEKLSGDTGDCGATIQAGLAEAK